MSNSRKLVAKKPPARPSKREDAKEASREALIRAAMELVPEKGLDVSLDLLCAHAGYTRGAFYQHFPDREALIVEVMDRVGAELFSGVFGVAGNVEGGNLFMALPRIITALQSGKLPVGKGGYLRSYQLLEACAKSPRVLQQYQNVVRAGGSRITEALRAAQLVGLVDKKLDVQATADVAVACFIGLRTLHDLDMPVDLPRLLKQIMQWLR